MDGEVPVGQTTAAENRRKEEFPAGMRVLAVDDDPICLKLLENLLRKCQYKVTVTPQAVTALKLLRESKEKFDIVISDVHMPEMDGFKLLEIVGVEMGLPVIMMSANSEFSTVMKGIMHGARDYLLKPIRIEELKNIWQHVIRKALLVPKEGNDTAEKNKCEIKGMAHGASKFMRKCREKENMANDYSDEDLSAQKKPRISWSAELHARFLSAVNHLGIEEAVPKKILDLMKTPGLTRESVASHLQKYRRSRTRQRNNAAAPNGISGNPPNASILSFDEQGPDAVNYFEDFGVDGYSSPRIIQFDHPHNSVTFCATLPNPPAFPLVLSSHDRLLQQYPEALEVDQLHQRIQNPVLADVSSKGSSKPVQLDAFIGNSSLVPGSNTYSNNGPYCASLPEYTSHVHTLGIPFNAADSLCLNMKDGIAADLDAITPHYSVTGTVQNSLSGQYEGPEFADFIRKVDPGNGNSLKVPSCSRKNIMESGQFMAVENPPMDSRTECIFDLSSPSSSEDLNAVVKKGTLLEISVYGRILMCILWGLSHITQSSNSLFFGGKCSRGHISQWSWTTCNLF